MSAKCYGSRSVVEQCVKAMLLSCRLSPSVKVVRKSPNSCSHYQRSERGNTPEQVQELKHISNKSVCRHKGGPEFAVCFRNT